MTRVAISPFPHLAKTSGWRCTECHHIGPQEDMCSECHGGELVLANQPFAGTTLLHRSSQVLAAVILVIALLFGVLAMTNGAAVQETLGDIEAPTSSEYEQSWEDREYRMVHEIAQHHARMGLLMVTFGVLLSGMIFWRSKPDSLRDPVGLVLLILAPSLILLGMGITSNYGYLYFAGMPGAFFGFMLAYLAISLQRQNWNLRRSLTTECAYCGHIVPNSVTPPKCPSCPTNHPTPIPAPPSQWFRDNLLFSGMFLSLTLAHLFFQIHDRLSMALSRFRNESQLSYFINQCAGQEFTNCMERTAFLHKTLSPLLLLSLIGFGLLRWIHTTGRRVPLWLPLALLSVPLLNAIATKLFLVSSWLGLAFLFAVLLFRGPSHKPIATSPV